jgi:hypothetical protein
MIPKVKELNPKLDPMLLSDLEVLKQAKVPVVMSGSDDNVPTGIAVCVRGRL